MTPLATYRLQLRQGVGFDEARALLPRLTSLGVSHLYLSPILAAVPGSTHGYDVIDPNVIEPWLGGREGFSRLSAAAKAQGLAIILDIVPNHTAFSTENPWLRDVLRHGEASRYARHFDIDWAAGRLVLPFLPSPFEAMLDSGLEAGSMRAEDGEDGPILCVEELAIPLTPGELTPEERAGEPDAIRALHDRQPWRLAHWELERDGITHRRFFNVTGLIGMRVEDEAVFDDSHALILDLVRSGEVQALRVDHIDGLADPGAYLARLSAEAGVPVWVEKILMGDETLAPWPVEGTTGYEAGAAIARVLTDPQGLARLDALWREATGEARSWEETLAEAKAQVIRQDLAAELAQLRRLAQAAVEASPEIETGEESLRESILALLVEMPRYRTYLEAPEGNRRAEDLRLLDAARDRAAKTLVSDTALRWLAEAMADGATPEALALRTRFQQVTGALMAKSQEDTAFFRFTRCLAHCEVGAEPGDPDWTPARLADWANGRSGTNLTLTSSHDTKRAEDARARLLAITHDPEAFGQLFEASEGVPGAGEVAPGLRWYIVQSLLAMWEEGRVDLADRLATHVEKAIREAREVTTWAFPKPAAEARAEEFSRALAQDWMGCRPEGLDAVIALGDRLALGQLALKFALPGIPDLYQGAEGPLHQLTDPDNRMAVDWPALDAPATPFAEAKAALTRRLLMLRAEGAFDGPVTAEGASRSWRLTREGAAGRLALALGLDAGEPVAIDWAPRFPNSRGGPSQDLSPLDSPPRAAQAAR